MKPFNLQAAIDGAPIQFKEGGYLKFIAYAPDAGSHQKVIVMDSEGDILVYSSNPSNIVMAPVVRTHWANVHRSESGSVMVGVAMPAENAAQLARTFLPGYVKTISFEVEE